MRNLHGGFRRRDLSTIDEVALADVLESLRAGLKADGFVLHASWRDDRLRVEVGATAEACADCLVPKRVLAGIVASMLEKVGVRVSADDIDVKYPDGSAAH
jgi:hypothetical protein